MAVIFDIYLCNYAFIARMAARKNGISQLRNQRVYPSIILLMALAKVMA